MLRYTVHSYICIFVSFIEIHKNYIYICIRGGTVCIREVPFQML